MAINQKFTRDTKNLPQEIVKQMLTLATSGFGLVAALAWNEFIKEAIQVYIKPYVPKGSTVVSLFIYAMIVTSLAVMVTLQLTKLKARLERDEGLTKKKV
ncbi:MAG: hypothetical protein A2900_00145 [Candidatus Chisholmbacteria bacterium RIFCSPLOWO2_01_FULL_50_28]|uniref:Uncharacterized protein n=1 Tax=Candidatus Chisholmbacteria bacterium RIFCSPHIGHO2_01_FULL_52_32 TaxID=1797591 RepID=A0A1G1VQW5_9BACT|nr:MAG: hypothetical protein A2786_00380 [Candidatus Chisholmbacteria bacterium RIFCSPHIGHO2_01_FULL_52_32]OGY20738.1 MAG: hypothetical protein A2900_00145 [Candidatus Chisholmbacteria bacterium RIFCSPLOWO2_01_FULL_50_28]